MESIFIFIDAYFLFKTADLMSSIVQVLMQELLPERDDFFGRTWLYLRKYNKSDRLTNPISRSFILLIYTQGTNIDLGEMTGLLSYGLFI